MNDSATLLAAIESCCTLEKNGNQTDGSWNDMKVKGIIEKFMHIAFD